MYVQVIVDKSQKRGEGIVKFNLYRANESGAERASDCRDRLPPLVRRLCLEDPQRVDR